MATPWRTACDGTGGALISREASRRSDPLAPHVSRRPSMTRPDPRAAVSALERSPRAVPPPPEERFWQRYSPHHELSLSGTASLVLHALVMGLLLTGGLLLARAGLGQDQPSVAVGTLGVEKEPGAGLVDPAAVLPAPAPL